MEVFLPLEGFRAGSSAVGPGAAPGIPELELVLEGSVLRHTLGAVFFFFISWMCGFAFVGDLLKFSAKFQHFHLPWLSV